VLDRLLEHWLDNASERSYQAPFCQMLIARGHRIVHSTRHSPIEFGKDVISIASDKVPCAFQLKGNPGSRLTLIQFREIQGQLIQLATQPIIYPGVSRNIRHRCYLVTNGEVDEEAQKALEEVNLGLEANGYGSNRIEIWARGQLLEMAKTLGPSLWPSEISDLNALLKVLVIDGRENFPAADFHGIFKKVLLLEQQKQPKAKSDAIRRRVASAAVLTGLSLGRFSQASNHQAVLTGWTMFSMYAIAAVTRYGLSISKCAGQALTIATDTIRDALTDICNEIQDNPRLGSNLGHDFGEIYRARLTMISGLMSLHWLWSEKTTWKISAQREFLASWIPKDVSQAYLWGEGAVPQLLAHYWYLSSVGYSFHDEFVLATLVRQTIHLSNDDTALLPSPYFTFENVMRHRLAGFLDGDDVLEDEAQGRGSYTAEGLFHLLVTTNLKATCKALWPAYSDLIHARFEPAEDWQYCLWRSDEGTNPDKIMVPNQEWAGLVAQARDCRLEGMPRALRDHAALLLLYVILFPFRTNASVLRFLGHKFGTVWFVAPAITE